MPKKTPSKTPNWANLRLILCDLPPDGKDGFEGLVAHLFEAETGSSFYLARKGDQPVGDAYSPNAAIILQAKRYKSSKVSEREIEGEIDDVLRPASGLDVYVVAVTKSIAQLAVKLERKTKETGLDILPLDLGDELTEFGALCVTHWGTVAKFSPKLGAAWQNWATKECGKAETKAALLRLRQAIDGLATRKFVSEKAFEQLGQRFHSTNPAGYAYNNVQIDQATTREGLLAELRKWWQDKSQPVCVLRGEEGMGKTWVAAEFVDGMPKSEAPVVFWLDSLSWVEAKDVECVVEIALRDTFVGIPDLRTRIARKIFKRWSRPILLILDGVNERGAKLAAERILAHYNKNASALLGHLRILFTTRPLDQGDERDHGFWHGGVVIPVGPFMEAEFQRALAKITPEIPLTSVSPSLRTFARIPRYFRLCIKLRDRLNSIGLVTKEIVLWEDLREKLSSRDPQIEKLRLALGGTPEEILAHLAKNVTWPTQGESTIATAEILQHLPNFQSAQADLQEQRIVVGSNPGVTTLSADHLVLGLALVLRRLALTPADTSIEQLRDSLLKELEPASSNDEKMRAVHLAALLTFLEDKEAPVENSCGRATLFSIWVANRNARATVEELQFFAKNDLAAYIGAVEHLFSHYLEGGLETALIAPLALQWKDQTGDLQLLRDTLQRWLRLIFPGDASGSKEGDETPPNTLTKAASREQVRLSYSAISIISFRPDISLLPDLLVCFSSCDFCYMDHGSGGKPFRLPVKSAHHPIGTLLRWGYTESVFIQLTKILNSGLPAPCTSDDLLWFSRHLRIAELPIEIGPGKDIWSKDKTTTMELFLSFQKFLKKDPTVNKLILRYSNLGHLAIRRELPTLDGAEIDGLIEHVSALAVRAPFDAIFPGSQDYKELEMIIPWLARYAPAKHQEIYANYFNRILSVGRNLGCLIYLSGLAPLDTAARQLVNAILNLEPGSLDEKTFITAAVSLTEAMLLNGDPGEVFQWLKKLESKVCNPGSYPIISFLPIPDMLELLAPGGLAESALREFENSLTGWKSNPHDEMSKRACCHWLQIYAYVSKPDTEIRKWALQLADTAIDKEEFVFPLLLLVADGTDDVFLLKALRHPAFKRFHTGFNAWRWGEGLSDSTNPRFTFSQLSSHTSLTVSGWLLYKTKNDEELKLWGRALTAHALRLLENDAVPPEVGTAFEVGIGSDLLSDGVSFKHADTRGTSSYGPTSPTWGVDRHHEGKGYGHAEYEKDQEQYLRDLEAMRKSTWNDLFEFNVITPFHHWAHLEPGEFLSFAEVFFGKLKMEGLNKHYEMAGFISTVANALLRINPTRALSLQEWPVSGSRSRVTMLGGSIDVNEHEIWSSRFNANCEILALRRQLLFGAVDDESLLWYSVAAHHNENIAGIRGIADECVAASSAKDRALGVTLLAFEGDEAAFDCLIKMKDADPSYWVREHATWAMEVCANEQACKQVYREILASNRVEELAAGLAELRLAITPIAKGWNRTIERAAGWPRQNQRVNAYLTVFWYHWDNTSSHKENIEIQGRRVKERCRGERLEQGVTDKQHPWWKP